MPGEGLGSAPAHSRELTQRTPELYGKEDFCCDVEQGVYHCRYGSELSHRQQAEDKGRVVFHYENAKACVNCPLKARCTKAWLRTVSR